MLTASLAIMVGALGGILAYPYVRDQLLLRDLGSENLGTRYRAILEARQIAAASPATVRRLEAALDAANDTKFAAIASVLKLLDRFYLPARDPVQIDRLSAIELAALSEQANSETAAETRWMTLAEVVLNGRDNAHVRRAMALAAEDKVAWLRQLATMLAARVGDDGTLAKLLKDKDPAVASAAALSVAAARRAALADGVAALLDRPDAESVSSAAYALARLDPRKYSPQLGAVLRDTKDARLRDRLLHVMTVLDDGPARKAVLSILRQAGKANRHASAAALLAAGRIRLVDAIQAVRDALNDRRAEGELTEGHLLAAMEAADLLEIPVRAEVNGICRQLWGPDRPLVLIAAARMLAAQAALKQNADAPSRQDCLDTLGLAAAYSARSTTGPAQKAGALKTTPLPSAAAAVSLWLLGAEQAESAVRRSAGQDTTLPGDYVAWHLALANQPERTFALGLRMLPALDAPQELRVYNDNERSAGAVLLALSARTDPQRQFATRRIASRLEGASLGGEDDPYTAGAYRCALLILGQADLLPAVRSLRSNREFPQRRVVTSLCAAGDKETLDWLLFNKYIPPEDIASLLTVRGIGEVMEVLAASLPRVDAAADADLQLWQVRILRHHWGVRRDGINVGLER